MKKIVLFSMLTFSVLSLSLAGCGNKKTASTNDSKPKQETKKATQKSSSQQEMKNSHSSVTGQNSNVAGENPSENAAQPSAGTDETNEVPQNQAPDTNITITNVVFNPERNEINGTTLPNATITATVVGDASAQAGVFYADANGNFTVISPRAGATTQLMQPLINGIVHLSKLTFQVQDKKQRFLLAILRLIRNKGQFLVKQHLMQLF